MNLSQRSKLSLGQFLTLFGRDDLILLLGKYGLSTDELEIQWGHRQSTAAAVREAVLLASASQLEGLVQELARLGRGLAVSICYFLTKRFNADAA